MAAKRKRKTRKKATKINYSTVSCGHTKAAAASGVKALHKKGFCAKKVKTSNGYCIKKGRKRK